MTRRFALAFALLAALAAPAAAQPTPVKDTADLFPADTLLFVDVVKPAEVAREVSAFIKGTPIENMSEFMAKWYAKLGDGYYPDAMMLGTFSAFAGPEAMAEAARMQGAALAITGVSKKGEPEIVGVILPGQSNVPGFVMRIIMSVDMTMRPAGTVEGVTIFGEVPRNFRAFAPVGGAAAPAAPAQPPKPEAPFIATIPGAIVIGSSLENTSDVVKRIKGKAATSSLSGSASFKDVASLRARPGIFAYANPGQGMKVLEQIVKENNDAVPPIFQRGLIQLLNPTAIRGLGASLALTDGTFDLKLAANVEPGKSSPILDLFANQKASLQLLNPVPKDSVAAFSLTLADGEKQFKGLLAAADVVVGEDGPKPSDFVKQLDEKMKGSLAKDVAGRIAAITVALPGKQELPKGATEVPMIFFTATDASAAESLEKSVAPLISAILGDTIEPVTETIQGVKVRSLPAASFPWKAPLHYGRSGTTLTLGADRKLVAASLLGKVGDSLAANPVVAESLQGTKAAGLGVWRWGTLLPEVLSNMGHERKWGPNGQQIAPDPAKVQEKIEKLRKAHAELIQKLPPLVVAIGRRENQFTVTVQQRHPAGTPGKLIEGLFNAVMSSATNIFENLNAPAAPAGAQPIKN
jgi:hypothetical protein